MKKIKLPSTGGEITEQEFSKRIDQIMHILNAVIECDGKQLFGYHGKTIGWCMPEMRDQVVGYKLALCKLHDDYNDRRKRNQEGEKYIAVREKNKPWVMTLNPNYKEVKNDNR